jgi:hypothetical protein
MRMPSINTDSWELRSGEAAHAEHPDTFWIPPLGQRKNLQVGQAAKLIFDIECQDEEGNVKIQGERMWVIVSDFVDGEYVGILVSKPATFETSDEFYLCYGAEIPFWPEHIVDIANPPEEYVKWQLSQPPERKWPRT